MIVATDAPVDARNLHRMGARTMMALVDRFGRIEREWRHAIAFTTSREPKLFLERCGIGAIFRSDRSDGRRDLQFAVSRGDGYWEREDYRGAADRIDCGDFEEAQHDRFLNRTPSASEWVFCSVIT